MTLPPALSIPYGKQHLSIRVPDRNLVGVFWPNPIAACPDPELEVQRALDHPLGVPPIEQQNVTAGEKIVILLDDYTRGTPVPLILPQILTRLKACNVRDEDITLLISTGTHRPTSESELKEKLGSELDNRFRVVQHDCTDLASQVFLGLTSRGTPVWVHRLVVESDHVFGIGHVDPSDYAGYAGGWKLVVPGVAALETIDHNHSLATLSFRCYGNVDLACRQDIDEAGSLVKVDQFVNVVLNQDGQIARAFAGTPKEIHAAGVALAKKVYEVECQAQVDIVVVSAYPYDIDFYQAIRAVEYADVLAKPGGSILVMAPCQDGIGSEEFYRFLAKPDQKPDDFLRNIARRNGKVTYNILGYFLTQIRAEKRLFGFMPGISDAELAAIGIQPVGSIQTGIDSLLEAYGPHASLAVLPVGSATIPRLV